ncbi:hypothetical protein [Streptomyces sp. NPDC001980]|uniref:hypothetical protein n=1 Tax=Streptomyces sp. NPDC001980 TaxID=3157126 RepID=UPI00331C737B
MPPPSFVQPALFHIPRTFRLCGTIRDLGRHADPQLAAWADQLTRRHAARCGWKPVVTRRVRFGVHAALALLKAPGAYLVPADIAPMTQLTDSVRHITTVLRQAGLLEGDRIPAVVTWVHKRIAPLPAPMAEEVRAWLTTMSEGRTDPPRRRPRAAGTIRNHLSWALPALIQWTAAGKTSLREITPHDVRTVRPPAGVHPTHMLTGLRCLFRILKDQHIVFTDPTHGMKVGAYPATIPLPLDTAHIRDALTSTDPAQAALCALIAFHALTPRQIQHLTLTDYDTAPHPRLTVDGRTISLTPPVADRLDTYLVHRHQKWPVTANPHLFINRTTAITTTAQVDNLWIGSRLGPRLTARALREDLLLHEAHATGGDLKHLTDLFGLSTNSALRYTSTVTHPGLDALQPDAPPGGRP